MEYTIDSHNGDVQGNVVTDKKNSESQTQEAEISLDSRIIQYEVSLLAVRT